MSIVCPINFLAKGVPTLCGIPRAAIDLKLCSSKLPSEPITMAPLKTSKPWRLNSWATSSRFFNLFSLAFDRAFPSNSKGHNNCLFVYWVKGNLTERLFLVTTLSARLVFRIPGESIHWKIYTLIFQRPRSDTFHWIYQWHPLVETGYGCFGDLVTLKNLPWTVLAFRELSWELLKLPFRAFSTLFGSNWVRPELDSSLLHSSSI